MSKVLTQNIRFVRIMKHLLILSALLLQSCALIPFSRTVEFPSTGKTDDALEEVLDQVEAGDRDDAFDYLEDYASGNKNLRTCRYEIRYKGEAKCWDVRHSEDFKEIVSYLFSVKECSEIEDGTEVTCLKKQNRDPSSDGSYAVARLCSGGNDNRYIYLNDNLDEWEPYQILKAKICDRKPSEETDEETEQEETGDEE